MTVEYAEPAGATHGGMIEPTTPEALEFLRGVAAGAVIPAAPGERRGEEDGMTMWRTVATASPRSA